MKTFSRQPNIDLHRNNGNSSNNEVITDSPLNDDTAIISNSGTEGPATNPTIEVFDSNFEVSGKKSRKRKRGGADDALEDSYMRQLAREEAKEETRQALAPRRRAVVSAQARKHDGVDASLGANADAGYEPRDKPRDEIVDGMTDEPRKILAEGVPQHESIASKRSTELEKSSRTVFLANVSTMAIKSKTAKKTLVDHLTSFLSVVDGGALQGIESMRFRSTPFSDGRLPKKAAYAKKEIMDSTAKSTNAYAVYTTQADAREAVKKLNGKRVLDRHLRVDSVAHPSKQDHRRCVFVGNLGFVDDESAMNQAEDDQSKKRPKAKEPADYEEGLWRIFGQVGVVESVRLVRDKTTRVGKGFAYVQFENANAVEKALLFNDKKFPPMLPRKLRVVRAKSLKKKPEEKQHRAYKNSGAESATYNRRIPSAVQSLSGRANKLLGRAGAAQLKANTDSGDRNGVARKPESFVFEGHRASQSASKKKGSKKVLGKPQNRSSKRGADFKRQRAKK